MKRPLIPPRPQLWVGADNVSLRDPQGAIHCITFHDADALRAGVATLAAEQSRWRAIDVVVSDAHCRYLVLPRIAGTQGRRELADGIAARFAASFGDDAADWLLQYDAPPFGSDDLVCGMRRSTAEAILDGLRAARRRVFRMQPLWVWCSESALGKSRAPHWLASSDGHTLTLGLFQQRRCVGVRATRLGSGGLVAALNRETALQAAHSAGTPVWLFGGLGAPARLADGSPVIGAALPAALVPGGVA